MSFLTANESQRKRGDHHTSFQINFRVSSTNFWHRHWCNSDHISKLETTFKWQQVSKRNQNGIKTEVDHRGQGSGNEYGKYYALFGDRNLSKDFKMTHSVGGRAPWLTGAGVGGTWIPVCCFLSSRYGISSYCGFPLLQPVKALEFFQHRILRSKYLNFLEEFFIVFISDVFGKFRKSQQAAED